MRRHQLLPLSSLLLLGGMTLALACSPSTPPPAQQGGASTPPAATSGPAAEPAAEPAATPAADTSADATAGLTSEPATPVADPASTDDGATVSMFDAANFYALNCAGCHGASGEGGKGPAYKKVLHGPDAELAHEVLEGKGKMPPFRDKLSPEEAGQLIAWIRAELGGGQPPSE